MSKKINRKKEEIELYDLDEEIPEEDFEEEKSSKSYNVLMAVLVIILIGVAGMMSYFGYKIFKELNAAEEITPPEVSIDYQTTGIKVEYTITDNLLTATFTAEEDGYYFAWLLVDEGTRQIARTVLIQKGMEAGATAESSPVVVEDGVKYIIRVTLSSASKKIKTEAESD